MSRHEPLDRAARDFLLRRTASNDDAPPFTSRGIAPADALQVGYAWDLAGLLGDDDDIRRLRADALAARANVAPVVPASRRRWAGGAALAASIAIALVATPLIVRAPSDAPAGRAAAETANVATPAAKRRLIALPDGSEVMLDARSSIRVAFTDRERRIYLTDGRGYFTVRHEARPFLVSAGRGEILDLGTRFVVETSEADTKVSLIEGKVAVRADPVSPRFALRPGDTVRYARDAGLVAATGTEDPLDWTTGKLLFDETPLTDAVRRLSRYSVQPIRLDPTLAHGDRRVTGVFMLRNSEGFADMLAEALDLRVVEQPDGSRRLVLK